MGQYYNPQSELDVVARKLEPAGENYKALTAQLHDDEYLFAWYHRHDLPFDNAPFLIDEQEFLAFDNLRKRGTLSIVGYYALPGELFRKNGFWANT